MRTRSFRALVAAVAITLALPPGWCCVALAGSVSAAPQHSVPYESPPPAAPSECCPHCQQLKPPPAPEPSAPSAPEPAPQLPRCGECCERVLANPPAADPMELPAALPTGFLPVVPVDAGTSLVPLVRFLRATGPPLHVRLCIWLC